MIALFVAGDQLLNAVQIAERLFPVVASQPRSGALVGASWRGAPSPGWTCPSPADHDPQGEPK